MLEKMSKEPLPMAICHVSDDVLALLDYTEEEMENLKHGTDMRPRPASALFSL